MRITESKIVATVRKNDKVVRDSKLSETEASKHLASMLCEDPYLKKGQKVYIKGHHGAMGGASVQGTFQEESNGWARVKREDGSDYWVLYYQCYPL